MPTYDYECSSCDYLFEAFHSMLAKPLIDCPRCDTPTLIKLISPGATVIVKGSENPCKGRMGDNKSQKQRIDNGSNLKGQRPFWRDGSVNKKILKNPEKYIEEGEV